MAARKVKVHTVQLDNMTQWYGNRMFKVVLNS